MNTSLFSGTTKSLMVFDGSKRNRLHKVEPEILEGKEYGQTLSFVCKVSFLGAPHRSAGEPQRMKFSIRLVLS